jgi:hypothetical protein
MSSRLPLTPLEPSKIQSNDPRRTGCPRSDVVQDSSHPGCSRDAIGQTSAASSDRQIPHVFLSTLISLWPGFETVRGRHLGTEQAG